MKHLLTITTLVVLTVAPAQAEAPQMLQHYLTIQSALASDSGEGVDVAAAALAELARKAGLEQLAAAADGLAGSELAPLRTAFKELSLAMADAAAAGAVARGQLYYCPMAKGYWLQAAEDQAVRNPYHGSSMLRCGSRVEKVERG